MAPRVLMFVTNSVTVDTRVVKEAGSLARAGYPVLVLGAVETTEPRDQEFDGFRIERIAPDPIRGAAWLRWPSALRWALGLLRWAVAAVAAGVRWHPAVCHAHDLPTLPVAWWVARRCGARLVYDAHELFTEIGRLAKPLRQAFTLLEGHLIGRADQVITVNDSIAAELARRYEIGQPRVVMNCPRAPRDPLDRERSPLRGHLGIEPDVPLVLFQGMWMPGRGLEELVAAVPLTKRAHLGFLGWGPLRSHLLELARAAGVESRVHFAEGVPLTDLLLFTAGADLGAIPYRATGLNNYLTSPNKLFEYIVAGVPVVASRFPELTKVVEGRQVGRTFDPESAPAIAAAIDALLEDPEALAAARRNVAVAAPDLTWERQERVLLSVYDEVAGAGRGSTA